MVHHHMEITEIERLQIVSSLVHSSLVVHCSYRLKFMKDSFLSNCRLLSIVGLDHVQSPWWQTLTPFPATHKINRTSTDISLWISGFLLLYTHQDIVLIAAHSWGNIPCEFSGRWNVLLARIDYMMHSLSKLFPIEMQQWPDTFQSCLQSIASTLQL